MVLSVGAGLDQRRLSSILSCVISRQCRLLECNAAIDVHGFDLSGKRVKFVNRYQADNRFRREFLDIGLDVRVDRTVLRALLRARL